jgi:glutathione S-transferase
MSAARAAETNAMSEFVSLTAARELTGLRLAMVRHIPSPWSQAAKGIFEIKGLPFVRAERDAADPDALLREWTGQESFPVVAYERERARTGWAEILFLAERLAPEPALVPRDPEVRTLMFGLAHEICGEMGLGWCGRLLMIHGALTADPTNAFFTSFGRKYGYSEDAAAAAAGRSAAVLRQLDARLAASSAAGGRYLLGDELSALDVYWATFSNLIEPLPPTQCPMPDFFRAMFTAVDSTVRSALTPALLAHRDRVFREHLRLPMEL